MRMMMYTYSFLAFTVDVIQVTALWIWQDIWLYVDTDARAERSVHALRTKELLRFPRESDMIMEGGFSLLYRWEAKNLHL
jgi:hypothetical protein